MIIQSFCLTQVNHTIVQFKDLIKHYSSKFPELTTINFTPHNDSVHVLISSQHDSLLTEVYGDIIKNQYINKSTITIDSFNLDALNHSDIQVGLVEIAKEFDISIQILVPEHQIQLFGSLDAIEMARVKVLVLLDQLSGLHLSILENVPDYLHYLIAGKKHAQLQSIMEETSTNIYLQSPFTCLEKNSSDPIYLTGASMTNLNRAKDLLMKLSSQKLKSMYHKTSIMNPYKIDWILLNKRDQLRKIMHDNGSFFEFPVLGSNNNTISIYAESRIYVERSIRLLNHLATQIYEATFKLIDDFYLKMNNFDTILSTLSIFSGARITFNSELSSLYLFGTNEQVGHACEDISLIKFFNDNCQTSIFSLELATDQREFVSGKKNGKINKIMKAHGVTVRFTSSNDYNTSITVESEDYISASNGFKMLQDELPAETSFYIPENYHRRIIGVGGKNIQKVMKQYGVYVKFSGAEEFTSLGGYFENEDNVVARTPMKNKENLVNLKNSVAEFINFPKEKEYMYTAVHVPFPLHRIIPNKYGSQLRDICRNNNTKIWWPERLGTEKVTVYGPQSHISNVISCIAQFVSAENLDYQGIQNLQEKIQESEYLKIITMKPKENQKSTLPRSLCDIATPNLFEHILFSDTRNELPSPPLSHTSSPSNGFLDFYINSNSSFTTASSLSHPSSKSIWLFTDTQSNSLTSIDGQNLFIGYQRPLSPPEQEHQLPFGFSNGAEPLSSPKKSSVPPIPSIGSKLSQVPLVSNPYILFSGIDIFSTIRKPYSN